MPTATDGKATRETWADWVDGDEPPDGEQLTRAQFIDRLRERGVDVSESKLVHWERAGALPRPVRRWRDGAPHAWYPPWLVLLAARIPDLQADGLELREIGPQLRAAAPQFRRITAHDTGRIKATDEARVEKFPADGTMAVGSGQATATGNPASLSGSAVINVPTATVTIKGMPPTLVVGGTAEHGGDFAEDLAPALRILADRYRRITGARIVRVEGRLTDASGTTITYGLDLDPE